MFRFALSKSPFVAGLALAVASSACGGATPPADEPASGAAGLESSPADTSELAWKDMDRDQRLEFMGVTVMPKMRAAFQEFDPAGFKDFGCKTCHGDDMEAVEFRMPNALMELQQPDPIPAAREWDAETTRFMVDEIVPQMQSLLQMEKDEFTCFSCHGAEQ